MAEVVSVDQETFDEMVKTHPKVVAKVGAPWCGPCRQLDPAVKELASEIEDVVFLDINAEKSPELAGKLGVMSLPHMFIFQDRQEVGQIPTARPKKVIQQELEKAFA